MEHTFSLHVVRAAHPHHQEHRGVLPCNSIHPPSPTAHIFAVFPDLRLLAAKTNELDLLEFLSSAVVWTARLEGDTICVLYVEDDRLVIAIGRDLAFHCFALADFTAQAAPSPALPAPFSIVAARPAPSPALLAPLSLPFILN